MSASDPQICEHCSYLECQNVVRFHFLYLSVIFTLDSRHRFYLYKIKIARINQKTCRCTVIPFYKYIVKVLRLTFVFPLYSFLNYLIYRIRTSTIRRMLWSMNFALKRCPQIFEDSTQGPWSFQLWASFPTSPTKPLTMQVPHFTSLCRFWITLVLLP